MGHAPSFNLYRKVTFSSSILPSFSFSTTQAWIHNYTISIHMLQWKQIIFQEYLPYEIEWHFYMSCNLQLANGNEWKRAFGNLFEWALLLLMQLWLFHHKLMFLDLKYNKVINKSLLYLQFVLIDVILPNSSIVLSSFFCADAVERIVMESKTNNFIFFIWFTKQLVISKWPSKKCYIYMLILIQKIRKKMNKNYNIPIICF